ncbi:MAG TPA: RNA-binding domain-containing protein [Ignavibacteria bacterium]
MEAIELLEKINGGETSNVQFKREIKPKQADDIIAEMVAMSNYEGGIILLGIEDKSGSIVGLSFEEIEEANNFFFNWATNNVKPAIFVYTETVNVNNKNILVVTIPRGTDKPYCDNNMVYWMKSTANKRRVAPSELKRLYQSAGKLYAERQNIENSSIDDIDFVLFKKFYSDRNNEEITKDNLKRIMQNLRLLENDKLTLAGAILFGNNNPVILPEFYISSICFFGNDISSDSYRDTKNISGNISEQFQEASEFILRYLKQIQGDKSFNSSGILEIPKIVFEEIIVNALVHRDYFINDSIKLFVFDNRIEIKSPGKLPNNMTINDVRNGLQRRTRNVVLTSLVNDILPYKGIGSGVLRALKVYPHIEFENNIDAEYFKVTISRPVEKE